MALRAATSARPFAGHRAAGSLGYARVLVPLVDRAVSEQAVTIACQLAVDRDAAVTAVTVIEVPLELPLGAHMDAEEEHARVVLAEARAIGDLHGVAVVGRRIRARAAGEAIVAEATATGAEVIVLSAPRKAQRAGGRSRVFGQTVDFVLKQAPCRVMVAAAPAA